MSPMEPVRHPGDLDRHIMRDLGFGVSRSAEEMHGSGHVIPEMYVPGTDALRMSILAAWADITSGYIAVGLFDPGVPVTLDLDVHLHSPVVGVDEVTTVARVQKAGRSVSVLSIDIFGDGETVGFAHATFMASPNPALRRRTSSALAGGSTRRRSQSAICAARWCWSISGPMAATTASIRCLM